MEIISAPLLTHRFEAALVYACQLHAHQIRKSSRVPYFSHLMSVAALVLEDGGDEDQAIAALLHDAVEDRGGVATREEIRRRFGDRVTAFVDGCTETDEQPKPPWQERKLRYLEQMRRASPEVRRISLADKLHNARSLLVALRQAPGERWDRFKGGKDGTLWFYRELLKIYASTGNDWLLEELTATVGEIENLA